MSAEEKETARAGRCCSCGYEGEEESRCMAREDGTHCNHWWDGSDDPEEEAKLAALGEKDA